MQKLFQLIFIGLLCMSMSGCIGTIVGAAVDTTIEVAKVPFKVAGAVIDVASGDDDDKKKRKKDDDD